MSDTGHKKELSDATTALAKAIAAGDTDALRAAAADHATALNSQATAMAASIAAPLYTQYADISSQIKALAEIVTNARQHDLNWRTEERDIRDAQSTRLYAELDKLITASEESGLRLGKMEVGQRAHSDVLVSVIARLDHKREQLRDHDERIHTLEVDSARLQALEDAVRRLTAERGDGT